MTIAPAILDEAADWLMQLHASGVGQISAQDREACERWRQRSPEHARAWARAELLMHKLGGLPPALAGPALNRPARRAAVLKLAALLAVVPAAWASWRLIGEETLSADYRSATGERRDLQLADGSRLSLNTGTAIDVHFDAAQRLIHLRAGEILIQTATTAGPHRPFRVRTAEGRLEALGTRFSVRQLDGRTQVAVLDGAVRIEPAGLAAAPVLQAGQQAGFGAREIGPTRAADELVAAWTRGMLLADKMRLADFAAELQRYRGGFVRCDPALAGLRVSGAFPVTDTDRALVMLVSTYPVEALRRLRGRWVTLVPR